jgi:hypothetical protein
MVLATSSMFARVCAQALQPGDTSYIQAPNRFQRFALEAVETAAGLRISLITWLKPDVNEDFKTTQRAIWKIFEGTVLMKRVFSLVLALALGPTANGQTRKVVTAAQANGTYRYRDSEIRILALGHNQLRVQMDLIYAYKSQYGLEANTGQADGAASIQNDVAIFHPPGFADCTITIRFLSGTRIKVTQNHDAPNCGFGNHVTAEGTYRKTKAGRPKFVENR